MIILYVLLVAYILAINFYSFLLVKSLRDKEKLAELDIHDTLTEEKRNQRQKPTEKSTGKLCIAGLLGGAITIYVCMFVLKYKRSDMLLMVLMPLLGVLNIYLWVLLFRSGFSFFVLR
ncbi:MAG: hypothetical protein E7364_07565 [Clostridiales bacterium]|nr:hypothetical protein [Clostridiales bacterium]MBE7101435.1 hypothetical protein [Clostridiales bacterium]